MRYGRWDALLFDLFDTLVLFDRERLPEIHVNGRALRSTAGQMHEVFRPFAPGVSLEEFVSALFWSWQEAERVRGESHREVPAAERFALLFGRLGLDPAAMAREALPILLATHMEALAKAVVFPGHHREVLVTLGARHRLAVVSNFDYTPTTRLVLEREGIASLFAAIVISDAVGWRKPTPVIFESALGALGVPPGRALFVGDRADIDVAGAHGVGMQAVWINRAREALPAGAPRAEFEIQDLAELGRIVGG
ncbi:MAG: HAD family hydrolase [Candidatus Rokubacteria bacterium]|nr:HAD family hydrolase [Candidatus Rokubacteria bacterium]